jgi:signal peptidase
MLLISVVLGFGVYSWNAATLSGNVMPMPFGTGVAVVLSGSMEPELSIDDLVLVRQTNDYKLDDIVVFQDGRTLVVHKIIKVDGNMVTTKGTANNTEDSPIDVKYIKGEVVWSFPYIGAVVTLIKSPVVTVAMLAASVYLLIKSYKNERCEEDKATISRAIVYLEAEGYLTCNAKCTKRYKSPLLLTDRGREVGKRIADKINFVLDELSTDLTEEERIAFYRKLSIISEGLEKIACRTPEKEGL